MMDQEELEQAKPLPYSSEETLSYLEQHEGLQEQGYERGWF